MLDIDENTVRTRAYEIWEADGRPEGCEMQHWERAIQDLAKAKPTARAAKPKSRARKGDAAPSAKSRRKALELAS